MEFWSSLSLLLGRIIMGGMFIWSGRGKLSDTEAFAKKNDIPLFLGKTVPWFEIVCGVFIVTGFLPRLAAIGLMGLMIGTMSKHIFQWKSPYWAQKGGWEYDLIWFTLSFIILSVGAGRFTVFSPF